MANSTNKSKGKSTKTATTKTAPKKTATKAVKTTSKKVATKAKTTAKEAPKKEVTKITTKAESKKSFKQLCVENSTVIAIAALAVVVIINIVIITIGHKVQLANGKEVIAKLNGKDITAEELFDKLKTSYGSDSLINMIDEYIVEKEITADDKKTAKEKAQENLDSIKEQYKSAGYNWEDVIKNYGYENEESILDEMMMSIEKELVAKKYIKAGLTDQDIKDYYDKNVYGKYTAKHILITPATTDTMTDDEKTKAENAAKEKANEVISKLKDGSKWADLVKEYSQDTGSKNNEGLIENFTKGDVADEFWNAVEDLQDGEYTKEAVKSSYGYHVIMRVSYTEKDKLKNIKDDLVDEIVTKKLSEDANLYTTTWKEIRSKYKLDIKDTEIKNIYEKKTK